VFSGRLTQSLLKLLDAVTPASPQSTERPPRHETGRRGEEEAYFYLRRRGYVMVARNYRSPRHHGEIDLIGWDKNVLCFIEVKTRTTRDVKPAEAAVDREKRQAVRKVVRDFLQSLPRRRFPEPPAWRFDVLTVYYDPPRSSSNPAERGLNQVQAKNIREIRPTFELFQNAALSA
jgi:putative endonuclease